VIPIDWFPPLMFAGLVVFMLIGYPVAFSLCALGLAAGAAAIHQGIFDFAFLQAIPGRIFGSILANELLLAIPFFTFMGAVLEKCGLAEDMLDAMGQLFGPVRGGLGYSVILVGFILGAITGTVAAQVIAMALISLPVMRRYHYDMRYATGILAASGTITQLVPPSLVLVVLADQLGKSVGDMYLGAWGPSVLQVLLFVAYTFALSVFRPESVPAVPREDIRLRGRALLVKCLWGILPCAALIFLVLGTLLLGLATPTESGAMGAIGAILLAVLRHRELGASGKLAFRVMLASGGVTALLGLLAFKSTAFQAAIAVGYGAAAFLGVRAARIAELRELIRRAFESTMQITAMVVFILVGSTCFSVVFQGVNGGPWLEHWLTSLPGGVWGFLLFVNLFVFFLAFFLDFFEIAFIIVPLLAPVAKVVLAPVVGEDAALVWFGVMLCVNLQTSFMHPPFGFALFYLRGVAPKEVKSADIYWGALPFVALQLLLVALVIAFPKQVTYFLDTDPKVDPAKVRIEIPAEEPRPANSDEELQRLLERK
jgi:tripartite ATP-independent transporter DctM subunit